MSAFWTVFIVVLTLGNIAACFWLIRWTAKPRPNESASTETTGHVWDEDLTEYNQPMPRWWLNLFYITIFFALVFEHLVVNMFLFPMGMLMGAEITIMDWLTWNEIPVIIGNLIGGLLLTGSVLYATHYKTGKPTAEYSEKMG